MTNYTRGMTPIHRIPRDGITGPLSSLIDVECHAMPDAELELSAVIERMNLNGPSALDLTVTLDWAMQLRDETGRSWAECLHTAQILYFG